jgi:hypothetical protein
MVLMLACFVAAGFVFRLCVLYLDIFPRVQKRERWLSTPATA